MLTTVTLASQYSLAGVWLGSTLGMVISDGLAIWVGQIMGTRLPERAVKIGAAAIFLAFGLFSLVQGITALQ
jgi:Ca2+/H+ antiporter, TMEM165/GDT1 family